MAAVTAGFQIVSIGVYLCILSAAAYLWQRWKAARLLAIPPGLWAGYGVVYYSLLLSGRLTPDAVFLWGAVHRLLAGVIFLVGLVALIIIMASPNPVDWGDDDDIE